MICLTVLQGMFSDLQNVSSPLTYGFQCRGLVKLVEVFHWLHGHNCIYTIKWNLLTTHTRDLLLIKGLHLFGYTSEELGVSYWMGWILTVCNTNILCFRFVIHFDHFLGIYIQFESKASYSADQCQKCHIKSTLMKCCETIKRGNFHNFYRHCFQFWHLPGN